MNPSPHRPRADGIVLDHLAHWVPDMALAAGDLQRLGFTLTPYTEHTHSPAPDAPVEPAGTANQCIMLREGYLEILTATADTALAAEVRTAMSRYIGVHLAAFGVNDAPAERERLLAQGFAQRPAVALKRQATMEDGSEHTLRFTVIRPQPGLLPEGRMQFLTQHTPELVWEERWLEHANGAQALTDLLLCSNDVDECAQRYARYLRTDATPRHGQSDGQPESHQDENSNDGRILRFERGTVTILSPNAARDSVDGLRLSPAPCIAGYAVRVSDLNATKKFLVDAGIAVTATGDGSVAVPMSRNLGGVCVFHDGAGPAWTAQQARP
ncbi:MAG: hypothetical protein ACI9DC_000539 [Gammaproteobacteria bacterium]|jgi:hypothetical protein